MTDHTTTNHDDDTQGIEHWADGHRLYGIPEGGAEITIRVPADAHPTAVMLAGSLERLMTAAIHARELDQLTEGQAYSLLNDVRRAANAAQSIEEDLILALRAAGASWATLASALDTGRSAAKERHDRIARAARRGLNTRGLDDTEAEEYDQTVIDDSATVIITTGNSVEVRQTRAGTSTRSSAAPAAPARPARSTSTSSATTPTTDAERIADLSRRLDSLQAALEARVTSDQVAAPTGTDGPERTEQAAQSQAAQGQEGRKQPDGE